MADEGSGALELSGLHFDPFAVNSDDPYCFIPEIRFPHTDQRAKPHLADGELVASLALDLALLGVLIGPDDAIEEVWDLHEVDIQSRENAYKIAFGASLLVQDQNTVVAVAGVLEADLVLAQHRA